MEEGASNPFSLFDKLYEAGQKTRKQSDSGVGIDRLQVQKMDEKRKEVQASGDQLRARPRQRNRPNTARIVTGRMENPGAE